jgi:cell division protein FtsZ
MHIEFGGNSQRAKIKVVGVGGGGGNAVANMIAEQMEGVEFIAINTDAQALDANPSPVKIQIGGNLTKGLGAGGIPDHGRKAALEDVNRLEENIQGADMVFIAAGMGGGTGTGAAPIAAQVARDAGALTVGVVTRPFQFEGRKRSRYAEEGIGNLSECVDTLITIPNQRLLSLDHSMTIRETFRVADRVLSNAVRGISDLITIRGDINVDFADVRTIMTNRGRALMGTGYGKGDRRAIEAAEMAINSPLLEDVAIDGAQGILVNITGGPDLGMLEVSEAVAMIESAAHEDAHIIFGYVTLDEPCDEVKITVIATGFGNEESQAAFSRQSAIKVPLSARSGYNAGTRVSSNAPSASGRPSSEVPDQVQISPSVRVSSPTVHRVSASVNSANLDIPAFIRKINNNE